MVLIVGHVNPHNCKAHLVDIPPETPYVVYMLLLTGKHCFLPFSYTNNNMHLGKLIRRRYYGICHTTQIRKTFDKFMKANVNQNFCPIQAQGTQRIAPSIFHSLTFVDKYTITITKLAVA